MGYGAGLAVPGRVALKGRGVCPGAEGADGFLLSPSWQPHSAFSCLPSLPEHHPRGFP